MDKETAVSIGLKAMVEGADGGKPGIAKSMTALEEVPCFEWRR